MTLSGTKDMAFPFTRAFRRGALSWFTVDSAQSVRKESASNAVILAARLRTPSSFRERSSTYSSSSSFSSAKALTCASRLDTIDCKSFPTLRSA